MGNLYNRAPFPLHKVVDFNLINYCRSIGDIRKNESFLEQADLNLYEVNNNYIMFERFDDDNNILITVNRTNNEMKTPIPSEYLNSEVAYNIHHDNSELITPYGGIALRKIKK